MHHTTHKTPNAREKREKEMRSEEERKRDRERKRERERDTFFSNPFLGTGVPHVRSRVIHRALSP